MRPNLESNTRNSINGGLDDVQTGANVDENRRGAPLVTER